MIRRDLFKQLAALAFGLLFPWYRTAKACPFVEVPWDFMTDLKCDCCADNTAFPCRWNYHHCELCEQTAIDDFADGKREARKFYRATDGSDCIVCEHCTAAYLAQ